jgi:hypothetical protein
VADVTLQTLIDRVRQRTDMVTSLFVTDAEITNWINQAKKELEDLLIGAFGEDYFASSLSWSVTASNVENYSLSTLTTGTFYKLMGMDYRNGSLWADMDPYTFKERNSFQSAASTPTWAQTGSRYRYRVIGGNVNIKPAATVGSVFQIHWTPQQVNLSAVGDTFNDVNGWSEYIVVRASICVKDKEESDTSVLQADLQRLQKRIDGMKIHRDASGPLKVVESDDNPSSPGFDWWSVG